MPDQPTVFKQVSDRTYFGRLAKTIFILMNVLMAFMFFSNLQDAPGPVEGIGAQLGFGLANVMLLAFWSFLNVVIGSVVFLTRRKRLVRVEDLLTLQRQDKIFRDKESVRTSISGLVLWICYTAVLGAWIATIVGLITGAAILWFLHRGQGAALIEHISDVAQGAEPTRAAGSTFGRRRTFGPDVNKVRDGEPEV